MIIIEQYCVSRFTFWPESAQPTFRYALVLGACAIGPAALPRTEARTRLIEANAFPLGLLVI